MNLMQFLHNPLKLKDMKTLIKIFASVAILALTTISCFETKVAQSENQGDVKFTAASTVNPELPSVFYDHLSEEIINSFQSGPAYDWMDQESLELDPRGEWMAVYGKVDRKDVDRKDGYFTYDLNIGGRTLEQSYLVPVDNEIILLDLVDSDKTKSQSVARFTSRGNASSVGYVNHMDIGDDQMIYYGWIYRTSDTPVQT